MDPLSRCAFIFPSGVTISQGYGKNAFLGQHLEALNLLCCFLTRRERVSIPMEHPPFASTALLRETWLVLRSLGRCQLHPVEGIGQGGISKKVAHVEHEF